MKLVNAEGQIAVVLSTWMQVDDLILRPLPSPEKTDTHNLNFLHKKHEHTSEKKKRRQISISSSQRRKCKCIYINTLPDVFMQMCLHCAEMQNNKKLSHTIAFLSAPGTKQLYAATYLDGKKTCQPQAWGKGALWFCCWISMQASPMPGWKSETVHLVPCSLTPVHAAAP